METSRTYAKQAPRPPRPATATSRALAAPGAGARSGRWPGCSAARRAGARVAWDKGGFDVVQSSAARQVRDYRIAERDAEHAELAIARARAKEADDDPPPTATAEQLVQRARRGHGRDEALHLARRRRRRQAEHRLGPHAHPRGQHQPRRRRRGLQARLRRGRQEGRRRRRLVQRSQPLLPALGHLARGLRRSAPTSILPAEHRFRTMRLKGEVLDEWPIFTTLVDADKVINVPVAKHHNLAKYTAAMKNWYGVARRPAQPPAPEHRRVHRRSRDLHAPDARRRRRHARAHAQRPAGRQHRRRAGHEHGHRHGRPGRRRRLRLHAHRAAAREPSLPQDGRTSAASGRCTGRTSA